jgi:hypothetical protein
MEKVLRVLLIMSLAAGFVFLGCDGAGYADLVNNAEAAISGGAAAAPTAATTISGVLEKQGTHDGYDYELWADKGTVTMVLDNGGNFSCEWSNIGNILCRKGKKLGSTKKFSEYGTITIDYTAQFNPNGNAYLCVYGWTKDPLVEYYIVESWGSYRPTGTSKGTATINGATYDLYETTRNQQPSIEGTKTFKQYWSVRQSKRTSGTITVSDHFKAWEGKGMTMGKMYEVALTVEGYQSSGNAKITSHYLSLVGGSSSSGSSGGSSSGSSGGTSSGGTSGGSATTPSTTTSSGATKVEAENMTKGGQYTGSVSSPFNGVILYANDDKVSFSQNFANNSHTFKVRGASSNSEKAQVQLKIGGTARGTFEFSGTSAQEKSITVDHGQGGKNGVTVELICINDNNKWDVLIDWIEISAASGSSSGGTTGGTSGGTSSGGTSGGTSSGGTSGGTATTSGSDQKITFSNLKQANITSGITASVNSSGALSVSYTGQYKEVKYDLASNLNLANCSSIVINASSPNGNTAVKFYDASGKEAFVQYNIKTSSAQDTTVTMDSAKKGNTIKTIGVMSQDTSNYSATVNSITFKGASTTTSSGGTSSGGTSSGGTSTASTTKYTFSQLSYASNGGGITYSVNSSGALSVSYTGQYKEVKYNLPSNINLSSYSAIVINASSPNGNTAVKFYDASGKEAIVQYNIKSSNAQDTTITLTSAQKGNTIKTIGVMSQDTSNYSATVNSITFR